MKKVLFIPIVLFFFISPVFSKEVANCNKIGLLDKTTDLKRLYNKYKKTLVMIDNNIYICGCENRIFNGSSEGRSLGGSSEGRSLGGSSEGRSLGGSSEGRSLGGSSEGRSLAGSSEGRTITGNVFNYTCSYNTSCIGFIINNLNNKEIKYYSNSKMYTSTGCIK